ncbi:hypothetical protein [Sphingomonas sp. BK580]|uniref:hypothetical protein n=1 Tax=Sphingomonas sp. BK580 TaxID=2586972 RepID=UPI00161330E8|nr:hypothetical protein [Sphingomonas sp. BK580]MBB3691481.1 hypothetical protein [Sphingomonas sp. BK580]
MHHVAFPPRRQARARAISRPLPPIAAPMPIVEGAPQARGLSSLDTIALQIVAGFVFPLPVIQVGHWLFGWTSVTVMFGGQ